MFCELCVWAEQVSVRCHVSRVTCNVSRSTTCVVVYLMLKYDWNALQALTHIRGFRPVEVVIHSDIFVHIFMWSRYLDINN